MIMFTSQWDDGTIVTTPVISYDPETGEVEPQINAGITPEGCVEREYITLEDGVTELDVCPECHAYVLKTIMVNDAVGKGLHEEHICLNLDCVQGAI